VPVADDDSNDDKLTIDNVKVFACFTEEFTSVTTTTSGTTTTEKTTTKFTSAGTTVTTVIATTTPSAATGKTCHLHH
jgi:hypothetical protein